MHLWINCDHCRKKIRARDAISNTVKCPHCGHLQWVPDEKKQSNMDSRVSQVFGKTGAVAAPGNQTQSPSRGLQSLLGEAPEGEVGEPSSDLGRAKPEGAMLEAVGRKGLFEHLYWALFLTLIPLGLSLFSPDKKDLVDRFERTKKNNPSIFELSESNEDATLDELIQMLPGRQIEGAFLPRDSWWHWAYAGVAAVVFLTFIVFVFPGRSTNPRDLILIGLFTGIIGVSFLLAVQFVAYYAHGFWVSGGGVVTIILLILNFVEFSYRSALDPNTNILWSFLGFTFGVGLLEELCKAAPLIFYYRNCETMSWRGACRWGLASGVGFGVAEAISYAADFYNGIETEGIYVVRFVSCVGLHGIWSASAGITLYRCQHLIQGDLEWKDYIWPLIRVLGIAMVLHGLYDTLLKKDMFEMALAVAVVSFGWLAWQIESLREEEKKELAAAC